VPFLVDSGGSVARVIAPASPHNAGSSW